MIQKVKGNEISNISGGIDAYTYRGRINDTNRVNSIDITGKRDADALLNFSKEYAEKENSEPIKDLIRSLEWGVEDGYTVSALPFQFVNEFKTYCENNGIKFNDNRAEWSKNAW